VSKYAVFSKPKLGGNRRIHRPSVVSNRISNAIRESRRIVGYFIIIELSDVFSDSRKVRFSGNQLLFESKIVFTNFFRKVGSNEDCKTKLQDQETK
jgi:hypothetical protein